MDRKMVRKYLHQPPRGYAKKRKLGKPKAP